MTDESKKGPPGYREPADPNEEIIKGLEKQIASEEKIGIRLDNRSDAEIFQLIGAATRLKTPLEDMVIYSARYGILRFDHDFHETSDDGLSRQHTYRWVNKIKELQIKIPFK